jgi:2-dehydro-3-deoxygalactonokinase
MTSTTPRLIGLDWGTTSCRGYLLGDGGLVLRDRQSDDGLLAVLDRARGTGTDPATCFAAVLDDVRRALGDHDAVLPVLASGMVGSRQGWAEAPYRRLPVDLAARDDALTAVRTPAGDVVHLVAGLLDDGDPPDVMRGEETQLLGALAAADEGVLEGEPDAERVVVLPGTHSKWVRTRGTTVQGFTTCMTGEVFASLTTAGTLAVPRRPGEPPRWEAFERGLDLAGSEAGRGGILRTAFTARSLVLTGRLAPDDVRDYLSGVLIGEEVLRMSTVNAPTGPAVPAHPVLVCGGPELSERYRRALERHGLPVVLGSQPAAPAGLWRIARATGLVPHESGSVEVVR